MPLLLLAPLVGFVLIVSGVRSRRTALNLNVLALLTTLGSVVLVGWARFNKPLPYKAAFQWINIPVSFQGAPQFQGFGIDVAFRVDHLALAALATLLLLALACVNWHRVAGRAEPGPVRYNVLLLLFVFSACGVVISGDLAELFAFWATAGVASYLLLGHRWGTEAAGRASRVALSLPFLGDLSLLCGVGLIYSRYGILDIDKLVPVLHTTFGAGLKSLTAASVLIFAGVAARAAVWPFSAWQSGTLDAPPSAAALLAGVWPVLAGVLLFRALPLFNAAGVQGARIAAYTLAVGAVAGPLLGLVGTEARRAWLLSSSAAVALGLLGMLSPDAVAVAATGVLAAGAARTAGLLALSSALRAMRTLDLRDTGAAFRVMRATAIGLLLGSAVAALAAFPAAAWRPQRATGAGFGAGLLLGGFGLFRVYFSVAHGALRRRRAFEPNRVREVAGPVYGSALVAGLLGGAALVLSFLTAWVSFLATGRHAVPAMGTIVLWLALPIAGTALGAAAFLPRRRAALAASERLGLAFAGIWVGAGALYRRYLAAPGVRALQAAEGQSLRSGEGGLGRALAETGLLASRTIPLLPALLALAVVLAVAFGLLSPGVHR